jgi:hypothetical protein
VSDRTRLGNRLHSILHHTLVSLPGFSLFSKRGIVWLKELPLAEEEAQARDSDLRLLEQTELEIAELEQRLVRQAWQDDKVRLLMQTMRRIIQRKNRSVAVVACARKLAVLLWHVLTSGEPFRYAPPKSLEAKYSRLRVRATGRRRRGAEEECSKARRDRRNMGTEEHGRCRLSRRYWRRTTYRRSLRWPREKESC